VTSSGQRTERLLGNRDASEGGSLPLSEVFSEILTAMYTHGPQPEQVLCKIAHARIGYKHDRIVADWGSWEDFYRDIFGALEEEGYIQLADGHWGITSRVRPYPQRNYIVRDRSGGHDRAIRAIVHPKRLKEARAELDAISVSLNDIILRLQKATEFDSEFPNRPFTHALNRCEGADRGLRMALQGEEPADEEEQEAPQASEGSQRIRPGYRRLRKMGIVSEFTGQYLKSLGGERVTTMDIANAYHEKYPLTPGESKVSTGTIAQKLEKMRGDGVAERIETGNPKVTKHGPRIFWRYIGEEE
jgi:hypothetical protein